MKNKWLFLCMLLLMALTTSLLAQQATNEKPFTSDEEAKIREGVAAVMEYIKTQQGLDSNAFIGGQNVPDIVDRALNKFGTAVSAVYANVQKAAPKVWMIMMQQQYAKALSMLTGPFLWFLAFIFLYRHMNKHWPPSVDGEFDNDRQFGYWFRVVVSKGIPILCMFISCCFLFSRAKDASLLFINPEYYAIRDLLTLLLGSSHGM